jgi:hypothetical protein
MHVLRINQHSWCTPAILEDIDEDMENSDADAQHLLAWLDVEASILNADQRVRLLSQLRSMQASRSPKTKSRSPKTKSRESIARIR